LIYALCIVRAPSQLLIEPSTNAPFTGEVQAREVITAYGRTSDAQWVLGWNKADAYGWVTANAIGCTVPIPELMPTESNVLRLTPIAVAEQNATPADTAATTSPTAVPTTALTAAPADTVAPPQPTATPLPATSTSTTEPTATSAPVATAPLPTLAPTDTAFPPVATALPAATLAPVAQATPIVIVQVVTVVVTVTAAPAQPTMLPTLATTQQPATSTPTAIPTLVVLQELRCVVTPGTPVNLRTGPARTERLLGQLREGAPFVVAGRNEDGSWLYGVTARGTIGWLIASAVSCEDDVNKLPVVDR
jgi:hypothetical protein